MCAPALLFVTHQSRLMTIAVLIMQGMSIRLQQIYLFILYIYINIFLP